MALYCTARVTKALKEIEDKKKKSSKKPIKQKAASTKDVVEHTDPNVKYNE